MPSADVILSSVEFTLDEIEEFGNEARELLRADAGRPLAEIKGGAVMIGRGDLKELTHGLEYSLSGIKGRPRLTRDQATCFLEGVDVARQLIDGAPVAFDRPFPADRTDSRPLLFVVDDEPDLPVILLSGYLTKETLLEAVSGVFGTIEKPFDAQLDVAASLRTELNTLLEQRRNLRRPAAPGGIEP